MTQIDEMWCQLRLLRSCADDQRVMTAEVALKQARTAALADRKEKIAQLEKQIEDASEARDARLRKKARRTPDGCPGWAQTAALAYYSGTTSQDKVKVVMWDEPSKLVWLNVPGHQYWSGRGETRYAESEYNLIRAKAPMPSCMGDRTNALKRCTGRVSRKQLTELINQHK